MKFEIILIVLLFIISSCCAIWSVTIPGCPVEIGDKVVKRDNGKKGLVISIDGWGSSGENCRIAVQYEDGTLTEDFVYNWAFVKL